MFIVISACSSFSTSFGKSIAVSRIDDGCDTLYFDAILEVLGSAVKFWSFS